MNVVITGGSGMIGSLILKRCLENEKITTVRSFVRKPTGLHHSKLIEIVMEDFENLAGLEGYFTDVNVLFFCLGVYTGQVPDSLFRKITVDYPVAFGRMLEKKSPNATFCLLSGAGADRTEKSRASFARYKGMAENSIASMQLKFHSFRPGYIYPDESRREPNVGYTIMKYLYPLIKLLGNKYSIRSTQLANAIFNVGLNGSDQEVLENDEILKCFKEVR
jgi:uncharacterized protein YbjT (DUF2867 family)